MFIFSKNYLRIFKNSFKVIAKLIYLILDWFAIFSQSTKEKPINMTIVRVDAIGDFILWLPSAQKIRKLYFDRKIVLICNQIIGDLARSTCLFDSVLTIDLKAFVANPRYRWKIVQEVRRLNAAVAIHPTYSRVLITGDSLVRATGAPQRIGSIGDLSNMCSWERWFANRWYTRLIKAESTLLMELERNSEFLYGLGIKIKKISVAEIPKLTELASDLKICDDYFIVFPGASNTKRMWPVEKFAAAARTVSNIYGWRMIICGTEAESALARAIIDHTGVFDSLDLTGQTTLPEFVELVRGARLLIGNETSAVHVAAAVKTPSVCLLGGGHFERFMPYSDYVVGIKPVPVFEQMDCFGCNWLCVKQHELEKPVPCIDAISLEATLKAVNIALTGVL